MSALCEELTQLHIYAISCELGGWNQQPQRVRDVCDQ